MGREEGVECVEMFMKLHIDFTLSAGISFTVFIAQSSSRRKVSLNSVDVNQLIICDPSVVNKVRWNVLQSMALKELILCTLGLSSLTVKT